MHGARVAPNVMGPVWLAFAVGAHAQDGLDGFDAHGLHLAAYDGDVRDALVVQRPGLFRQGDVFAGVLGEYSRHPLRLGPDGPVIDGLVTANASIGVALLDRWRIDAALPVHLVIDSGDASAGPPASGDVRLSTMLQLVRPVHGGGGLGVVGQLDLPSGPMDRFLGAGAPQGAARLAVTYEASRATVSADAGVDVRAPGLSASRAVGGVALGFVPVQAVGITLEGTAAVPVSDGAGAVAEALLSLRLRPSGGLAFTVGAAAGLTASAPASRVFAGLALSRGRGTRPADKDVVGKLRFVDLCPTEPETPNGWKDDDGCPDRLGTLVVDVRYHGESRSADAVVDGPEGKRAQRIGPQGLALDAVPGTEWTVHAKDGCLEGQGTAVAEEGGARLLVVLEPRHDATARVVVTGPDGSPLPSAAVSWSSDRPDCVPEQPAGVGSDGVVVQAVTSGRHELTVSAPGYSVVERDVVLIPDEESVVRVQLAPARVVIEQRHIRILEKVQFTTARASIERASFGLLDEVAAILLTNPDLGRIEVGGHTDSRGSPTYNQKLSQDRAEAVRAYLVEQGVSADRLIAVGYGESMPVDTNRTTQGRERNRRVEFTLLDKDGGPR